MVTPAPQDRWSKDKHIELVNIIDNPGFGMLTRVMAKELTLKHPGLVDTMQEELNQFARNKVWTLVLAPYGFDLKRYLDSDYIGCNMDRKSTLGACQFLRGKLMCWSAKKQQSIAMSSVEAEYVVVASCYANIQWIKFLHSRTKHIDIKYHFIRDHILKKDIELHFIPTQYQLADIFTKPLDEPTFKRLIVELGHDALVDFTTEADLGISATKDSLNNRLRDLADILKDTRSAFFTLDSLTYELVIVLDVYLLQSQKKVLGQEKVKAKAEVASMKAKPSYPNINQLTELLVTSLNPELSKLLASHDFASYLPTELKELPSKIIGLSREIKELKQHIKDMEIKLPRVLKEIPSNLETFTSTVSNLSSQVAKLKNIQWELPAEFFDLPHLASSVQEKHKTLDSLPGILKRVTNTLNRFATLLENASGATNMGVPLADKATTLPAEGEKDADTNLKNELVDLLDIDIVTQYYKWREVVQACPDIKEKGWKTIYEMLKARMEYLEQTEKELHIDLNKSLQEQDPLDALNELANKKTKRTDHPKSSKKHKSSSSI
nr:hypothetical protein [Tanacetum cinerariifolium]